MADTFRSVPAEESREWFDAVPSGKLAADLPEPNIDYMYVATRVLSWFPVVNSKGATYFPEDFDNGLVQTLVGKQVNLYHDKVKQVVGTVKNAEKNTDGIDVVIQVDREQADAHGLDPEDFKPGNQFSNVSVEVTKDIEDCKFLAVDDEFNVVRSIPVEVGRELGISRTTKKNPFRLQGKRVVERIKPARFTGLGFVPNPADQTARLYAVAAAEDTDERIKTDTPTKASLTQDADSHNKEQAMSESDAKALQDKLAALEAEVKQLRTEKEQAATEAAKVADLEAKVKELTETITGKESELASVTTERDTLKAEKETAAREAGIEKFMNELGEIKAFASDDERNALREKAAAACGEDGVIRSLEAHLMRLERENEALKEKVAADKPAEDKPAVEDKPEAKDDEKASADEKENFSVANRPSTKIGPKFSGAKAHFTAEELDEYA